MTNSKKLLLPHLIKFFENIVFKFVYRKDLRIKLK